MTDRMKLYRDHFPDDTTAETEEQIDVEYLKGTYDWWLADTGTDPEEIGVSAEAIIRRYREEEKKNMVPKMAVSTELVAGVMNQLMKPLLESIGTLLKNNTEAMEQIAASQDVIRNRMEALEKQVRLQTPITDRQEKYLKDAARDKARELLDRKGFAGDKKAVAKLAGMIRKNVMARFGGTMREIPKCEYGVAMEQISTWNSAVLVLDIVKEARERTEAVSHDEKDAE